MFSHKEHKEHKAKILTSVRKKRRRWSQRGGRAKINKTRNTKMKEGVRQGRRAGSSDSHPDAEDPDEQVSETLVMPIHIVSNE